MIMMWTAGVLAWLVASLVVGVVVGKSIKAGEAARRGHPGSTYGNPGSRYGYPGSTRGAPRR